MIPRLIHPVRVTLRPTRPDLTEYDHDAREPIQEVRLADEPGINVQGQPRFNRAGDGESQSYGPGGADDDFTGYILFRYVDLRAVEVELKLNDRITRIGEVEGSWIVERLVPTGHYNGRATMVKAFFLETQSPIAPQAIEPVGDD